MSTLASDIQSAIELELGLGSALRDYFEKNKVGSRIDVSIEILRADGTKINKDVKLRHVPRAGDSFVYYHSKTQWSDSEKVSCYVHGVEYSGEKYNRSYYSSDEEYSITIDLREKI